MPKKKRKMKSKCDICSKPTHMLSLSIEGHYMTCENPACKQDAREKTAWGITHDGT